MLRHPFYPSDYAESLKALGLTVAEAVASGLLSTEEGASVTYWLREREDKATAEAAYHKAMAALGPPASRVEGDARFKDNWRNHDAGGPGGDFMGHED